MSGISPEDKPRGRPNVSFREQEHWHKVEEDTEDVHDHIAAIELFIGHFIEYIEGNYPDIKEEPRVNEGLTKIRLNWTKIKMTLTVSAQLFEKHKHNAVSVSDQVLKDTRILAEHTLQQFTQTWEEAFVLGLATVSITKGDDQMKAHLLELSPMMMVVRLKPTDDSYVGEYAHKIAKDYYRKMLAAHAQLPWVLGREYAGQRRFLRL